METELWHCEVVGKECKPSIRNENTYIFPWFQSKKHLEHHRLMKKSINIKTCKNILSPKYGQNRWTLPWKLSTVLSWLEWKLRVELKISYNPMNMARVNIMDAKLNLVIFKYHLVVIEFQSKSDYSFIFSRAWIQLMNILIYQDEALPLCLLVCWKNNFEIFVKESKHYMKSTKTNVKLKLITIWCLFSHKCGSKMSISWQKYV